MYKCTRFSIFTDNPFLSVSCSDVVNNDLKCLLLVHYSLVIALHSSETSQHSPRPYPTFFKSLLFAFCCLLLPVVRSNHAHAQFSICPLDSVTNVLAPFLVTVSYAVKDMQLSAVHRHV